jgi:hypothetical protein
MARSLGGRVSPLPRGVAWHLPQTCAPQCSSSAPPFRVVSHRIVEVGLPTSSVNRAAGAPLPVAAEQVAKGRAAGAVLADFLVWDLAVYGNRISNGSNDRPANDTSSHAESGAAVLLSPPALSNQHTSQERSIHVPHSIRWWSSTARRCYRCRCHCRATLARTLDDSVEAEQPSSGRRPAARSPGKSTSTTDWTSWLRSLW